MYKKYLIIASKKDPAGINITTNLSQFISNSENIKFHLIEEDIIYEEFLNLERINEFDFIIFASKHSSSSNNPKKTLSIHAPGNWNSSSPKLGGKSEKISPTSALFQKQCFETLNKIKAEHSLNNFEITLEATHHGPLINKPCIFIEIGSTIEEWKNKKAGFVLAKTILETIKNFKENPYNEIAIGIGGPHYCPNFNKLQLNSNYAISHIIPSYVLPVSEQMILQAIEKTDEEIDLVLIDWKGIPNSEERQRIINILNKNYINYKKTRKIKK